MLSGLRRFCGPHHLHFITGSCYRHLPVFTYTPNGDVSTANDSANSNWAYTYDDFNRLVSGTPTGQSWWYTYAYDRFGNRWQQNLNGSGGSGQTSSLSFSGNNNRIDNSSYDAAGNLLNDGNHTYTYDAENRIIKVDNGATATYVYDANGQRIRKTSAAGTVDYLYDLAEQEVAEVSSTGTWNRGEVFAGGRHLATYAGGTSGTTYFIHADWLGTERARSNTSGSVCETIQSLPFGDGQATAGTCGDPSPNHFTDKQRDTESNLDDFDARYYSSALARFMIPDWAAKAAAVPYAQLTNPQTLNLYQYVKNNPVTFVDQDGHEATLLYQVGETDSFGPNIVTGGDAWDNGNELAITTDGAPPPPKPQPPPQGQNTSTVVVEQVKGENGNPAGHVVISVNGDAAVGLVPDSDKAAAKALAKEVASAANGTLVVSSVPGHVESLAAGRKITNHATIHVTPKQAAAMQAAIRSMAGHQMYDPAYRNCASFVEEVLRSGGVKAPNDLTPGRLVNDLNKQFPQ